MHKTITCLIIICFAASILTIPASRAIVTESASIVSAGTIVSNNIPSGLTLKFQTGFESATASGTTLNGIGVSNYIDTSGSGTAGIWMETGTQVTPHTGTKALGMQAGSGSYRCELDLYQNALGLSNQFFIDEWLYLPSNFTVTHSSQGEYYIIFQFEGTYTSGCFPIYSLMIGARNTDGTFPLMFGGRDYTGTPIDTAQYTGNGGTTYNFIQMLYSHFNLPLGQWFHFQWYETVSTSGLVQAWINGIQIVNVSNINTTTQGTQWYINTDIYFNSDDMTMHELWIDDLSIYG